ncbi:MAG: hypothetical protein KY469_02955 [Actinobacteria bacterium]|nr:hypothetical protein [Actinomycetota bacterium]
MSGKDGPDLELDVSDVLAEIGAEEAVARLEARVADLEQDLERAGTRNEEAERARAGELEVMRARVDDALELVRETIEDHSSMWRRIEERLDEAADATRESVGSALTTVRDDLSPKLDRATAELDTTVARITGQIQAARDDLEGRVTTIEGVVAEARTSLQDTVEELRAEQVDRDETLDSALTEVAARADGRLAELETSFGKRHDDLATRIDALRRELDGAAGELRASMNLKAQEATESVETLRHELEETYERHDVAAAELERRWIEGTREIARLVEDHAAAAREAVREERVSREEAVHAAVMKTDDLATRVTELDGRIASESARSKGPIEELRNRADELTKRLEATQSRLTTLAEELGSGITDRVATVTAEVVALREAIAPHEQTAAGLAHLHGRVRELAARIDAMDHPVTPGVDDTRVAAIEDKLGAIRRDLATLAGGVGAAVEQTQGVGARLAELQESVRAQGALTIEVRELTARTSELAARLDETDKLARAAGQAIASAVRRARASQPRVPPVRPLPEGAPSVAAAERPLLFRPEPPPTGGADPSP